VGEIVGRVIKKYGIIEEVIPYNPAISPLTYSPLGIAQLIIILERACYEVEINGQPYELVTVKECELPENAEIRIRSRRILKDMHILYANEEFPVISLKKQE